MRSDKCEVTPDVKERSALIERVLACLQNCSPGSSAVLRGSIAEGRSDAYSDIDITWLVPYPKFTECLRYCARLLSEVEPVDSLRWDPDYRGSPDRRVVFVRFSGVPLFWRVDLDIRTVSPDGKKLRLDIDLQEWSLAESALMNAVAAVKAHLRNRGVEAVPLLAWAFNRVGLSTPQGGLKEQIETLLSHIEKTEPAFSALAAKVRLLAKNAFSK